MLTTLLLLTKTFLLLAGVTNINEQNFERTLQEGDPWIIQFGSPDDSVIVSAIEALEKYEKSMNGLVNVGFFSIKDARSFRFAALLNLPSLRDLYYFNSKHNVTEVPENTWVFPLPLSKPVPFGCEQTEPTEENITRWALEHTPTRYVDYSTLCLKSFVTFLESTSAVNGISGNTVIFIQHPSERMMHLANRFRRSASFLSLCNKTNLRNALPGGPTMPSDTACVVMGNSIHPPKVFSGEPDAWLNECVAILDTFPTGNTSIKEINRRRRMATMARLQSNITEISDSESFRRVAGSPLTLGGLAIAFFTPSMAEHHARYIKHYNALASKYIGIASDGKHMPMRFFYINAEVHPGISRHMGVEKIPSLVCLLPASESRMARTSYDGDQFETEPMFRFMRDSMMQNQENMREYSTPEASKLPEYFSVSSPPSFPTEMEPCVHSEEAIQKNGLFYPSKDSLRTETIIDKSNSKKYLNVEAEKEKQRKKKEARNARMKNRERSKGTNAINNAEEL